MDGPPEENFYEVTGAIRLTNGLLAVSDAASAQVRIFSAAGEFVTSFGRAGDGPEEFRRLEWIDLCGSEAIVAYDSHRHRVTKWDERGRLVDEFGVDGPRGTLPPYAARCGPTGQFAVIGWPDGLGTSRARGPYRPEVGVGITNDAGRLERVLGTFPGEERLRTTNNDRPHPFGRATTIDIGASGEVIVGTADSLSLQMILPDGSVREFGSGAPPTEISPEQREQWVDHYLERAPSEQRPRLRRELLASAEVPYVTPAYAGFLIDRLGMVWVEPFDISGALEAMTWIVFDPGADRVVALVSMPPRFRPTDIGADYVVGVSRDDLDVERVMLFSLQRGVD